MRRTAGCCALSPACRNVEVLGGEEDVLCNVQGVTARDHPADWDPASPGWAFYQRNCA